MFQVGGVEPPKSVVFVAQIAIKPCDRIRRNVIRPSICVARGKLQYPYARAGPSARTKAGVHGGDGLGHILVADQFSASFPFLDGLRILMLAPVRRGQTQMCDAKGWIVGEDFFSTSIALSN